MVKLLGDGLCGDQGGGHTEMVEGVYYSSLTEIRHLQYCYGMSYALDPKDMGVACGETRVRFGDRVRVEQSVDHG